MAMNKLHFAYAFDYVHVTDSVTVILNKLAVADDVRSRMPEPVQGTMTRVYTTTVSDTE